MKKFLAIILCLTLVMTSLVFTVNAADELNVTVATDIHYSLSKSIKPYAKRNSISEDYAHAGYAGLMKNESVAIFESFLSSVAKNESSVVILSGDLVDNGVTEEEVIFAKRLEKFEADTGKRVFVIAGNHEYYGTSRDEFKAIYAELCYNEALAVHDETASYTADLDDTYRLIAIDTCNPGKSPSGLSADTVKWIEEQAIKAQEDGKHLIATMHHGLLEHYIMENMVRDGSGVPTELNLPEVFAKYDIKYTFTGHNHEHDIAGYEAENGKTVYDIVTGALTSYPAAYRVVSFTDENVDLETRFVEKIDTSSIMPGLGAKAISDLQNDFSLYAKTYFNVAIQAQFKSMLSAKNLKKFLGVTEENNPEISVILDKIGDRAADCMVMPLYEKDANGGESIEGHLKECGESIGKSDYKTTLELLAAIYELHVAGDENVPAYTGVSAVFLDSLSAVIHYALLELDDEEYVAMLNFLITDVLHEDPVAEDLLSFATNMTERFKGIEIVVAYAVYPVVDEFTVDDAPSDNDAVLSAYDKLPNQVQESINFFEMLMQKLASFLNWLKEIFSF